MPNIVENRLFIRGSSEERSVLRTHFTDNRLLTVLRLGGFQPEFDFFSENDACENEVIFGFDTAWSAPREFVRNLSQENPNMTFILQYDADDASGVLTYENGVMVKELCGSEYDYPISARPVYNEDGSEILSWVEPYEVE